MLRKRPPGHSTNQASRWFGPLRIIKEVGPVSYIVSNIAMLMQYRAQCNQIIPFKVNRATIDDVLYPDKDDSLMLLGFVWSSSGERTRPSNNISRLLRILDVCGCAHLVRVFDAQGDRLTM